MSDREILAAIKSLQRKHEGLEAALIGLLRYCVSGDRYTVANPYLVPEVKQGLQALAKAKGFTGDWRDVLDREDS